MATATLPDLGQFVGSCEFYRHPLGGMLFTDGVHYLAEEAGAFWLIDVVASFQTTRKLRADSFQLWRLERHAKNPEGAIVTARHDTDSPVVARQVIEYTDFPLDEPFEWYAIDNGQPGIGVTMMLKSEY
jgi:hypothetical protein